MTQRRGLQTGILVGLPEIARHSLLPPPGATGRWIASTWGERQ